MKRFQILVLLVVGFLICSCNSFQFQEKHEKESRIVEDAIKELRKIQACLEVNCEFDTYKDLLVNTRAKVNEAMSVLPDGELKTKLDESIKNFITARDYMGLFLAANKTKTIDEGSANNKYIKKAVESLERATKLAEERYK